MSLEEVNEKIKKLCSACKQCDPCCTGNILKKYIEKNGLVSLSGNPIVFAD